MLRKASPDCSGVAYQPYLSRHIGPMPSLTDSPFVSSRPQQEHTPVSLPGYRKHDNGLSCFPQPPACYRGRDFAFQFVTSSVAGLVCRYRGAWLPGPVSLSASRLAFRLSPHAVMGNAWILRSPVPGPSCLVSMSSIWDTTDRPSNGIL